MNYSILVELTNETVLLELNPKDSPKTVEKFLQNLPFTLKIHIWGEEIYTDESPISVAEENAKSIVDLNDVAYWPAGKAICLFFGPTPIGKKGEIKPYSPVNVIGKILNPKKAILKKLNEGESATFRLKK